MKPKDIVFGRDDLLSVAENIVYEYGKGDGEELCEYLAQTALKYLSQQ